MSRMPAVFIGHGSPMNAIQKNDFTDTLKALSKKFAKPKSILCISAHWMTEGTQVTGMPQPKTIHDFYGFPPELFAVTYSAPGNPELADLLQKRIPSLKIDFDEWGLDHGTWSVIRHMYPAADMPVVQLSLDLSKPNDYHFELGQKLEFLRDEGVLILGSGNIVHNLRRIDWNSNAKPFSWAVEFDEYVKEKVLAKDYQALVNLPVHMDSARLSIPTPEHYLPFLYILGAARPAEVASFEFEGFQNASISMRALSFGL